MGTMIQFLFWGISFITVWLSLVWIEFLLNPPKEMKNKGALPTVTLGIPVYNEESTVGGTLDSLAKLDYPKDKLQVIVVNDGSADNTAEIVKKYAQKYSFIKLINKENGGKASAVNVALKNSTSEVFGVLDADSTISPSSLKTLVRYLSGNNAAAISRIKVLPGNKIQGLQRFEYIMSNFLRKIMANVKTLGMTPGVLSVYKTDILRKVGGFTKDRENLTEDLEIALRFKRHGYDIYMAQNVETHTKGPASVQQLWNQRIRWSRGFIYNHIRYKDLFFSKKHGLFGMFQLPVNTMAVLLLILNISIISWDLGKDGLEFMMRSFTIPNYFMETVFAFPTFREFVLARNLQVTIPVLLILGLGIWMVVKAHRMFQERVRDNIGYGVVYTLVAPYWTTASWLSAIWKESRNAKRKW